MRRTPLRLRFCAMVSRLHKTKVMLLIALAVRLMTLIIMMFWGLMMVGMDKDFEP
ncbi:hypothetical protein U27_04418 [Candidatus Vecturithrix granuli]|uniref:Uncharacterized protein n=1 Tax=Vecturithrix granuli TaxID=1499967 RepID=A0A081BYP6_VECG1|nr:hypothetical protein U27_04418 [Candidatus Vecturithrix granuli]